MNVLRKGGAMISFFLAMLAGCESVLGPQSDASDKIVQQLAIGMTREAVLVKLGAPIGKSESKSLFDFRLFGTESYPPDLLFNFSQGEEIWVYAFWITVNHQRAVHVFFSKEGRVIGWLKAHSELSREKYRHEKITARLKSGLGQQAVRTMFGDPQEIVYRKLTKDDVVTTYADHFWTDDPWRWNADWEIWIYRYPLGDNVERKVYIAWNRVGVDGWGYDHAHIEAERYLREHKK